MASGLISRTRRSIEFARQIPPNKVLRRLELTMRRKIRDRFGPYVDTALAEGVTVRETAPLPLFPPRYGDKIDVRGETDLSVTFLGREISLSAGAVDWLAPGEGEANQLLRMMLHYMEYLEAIEDNVLWQRLVGDWIASNGAGGRGAWRDCWNSYALSLRVVVWMQERMRRGEAVAPEIRDLVDASLVCQLRFLENNLETDLGGNHLIKNIKALIWAGAYFDGAFGDRLKTKGVALLDRELDEQILEDGVHYERSPAYHCQVFADLLECRHALGEDPLNGLLDRALRLMADATVALTHPDGAVAQFNDAGLTMCYAPGACLDAWEALMDEAVMGEAGTGAPGMGQTRASVAQAGGAGAGESVVLLRDAGYATWRSGGDYAVIDCGAIAPDDLPAHGHGDVLSFEWSVDGQRIVVDQGVYEYVGGARRAASRAASHHNTLCFEGADQAEFYDRFRCGRRPKASWERVEVLEPDGLVFEGHHDGFSHLPGRPIHHRQISVSRAGLTLVDTIRGEPRIDARVGFLLHPEIRATAETGRVLRLTGPNHEFTVRADHDLDILPSVWWPDMGVERPTHRIQFRIPSGTKQARTELVVTARRAAEAPEKPS